MACLKSNDRSTWLNINQGEKELDELYGDKDYYAYLRSPQFRLAFFLPIANIIRCLKTPVLDVGCGEAVLGDYIIDYVGIDGSRSAITRALERSRLLNVHVGRMEAPEESIRASTFKTIVFGGIMEVLVKPEHRVNLLTHYCNLYEPSWFIIYDLERLDTSLIEAAYGKPIHELHAEAEMPEPAIEEVKLKRKVLVYKCG